MSQPSRFEMDVDSLVFDDAEPAAQESHVPADLYELLTEAGPPPFPGAVFVNHRWHTAEYADAAKKHAGRSARD